VALRARATDFLRWSQHGLQGWSFEEVLDTYKRLENTPTGETAWHGRHGPFPIRQRSMSSLTPSLRAFVEAGSALGFEYIDDFNAAEQHGIGPYPLDVIDGVRQNTGITYLTEQVRRRPNVTIRSDAQVDRVIFEDGHAVGVRLVDGSFERATTTILSAGVYGSPAILLRSGIGPAQGLRALGIPVVVDAPVGRRLMDHPFSFNIYALVPQAREMEPAAGAILWTNSQEAAPGELDVQISATHFFDPTQSPTGGAIVLGVAVTRPASIGTLALTSRDPRQAPRIELNFLAEARDRRRLLEGVKLSRTFGKTRPFADLVEREMAPDPTVQDDTTLMAAIRSSLDTYQHATSTAPMGGDQDASAVVDWLGAVRGVEDLRVVDASIFPEIPSTPTNVTVIMAAEHIAAHLIARNLI
jgi:choline dehydrogenase